MTGGVLGPAGLDGAAVRAWVAAFGERFAADRERLTDLDRRSGDGDFGTNLASALRKVTTRVDAVPAGGDPRAVLDAVSLAFLDTGGTSGPLFGMFFRDLARAAAELGGDALATAGLAAGVARGTATIQRLGGAAVGDKTMVDALVPAAAALEAAAAAGEDPAAALRQAADAAHAGAESTAELRARRGRASYVGDVARGVLDPGAVTVALFFAAGAAATAPGPEGDDARAPGPAADPSG